MKSIVWEKYKQKKEWRRRKEKRTPQIVPIKFFLQCPMAAHALRSNQNSSTVTELNIIIKWFSLNFTGMVFVYLVVLWKTICFSQSAKKVFSYSPGNDNLPDSGQGRNTETTFRVRSRHERSFLTSKSNIFDIWNFRKSEWFASHKKCLIVSSCHQTTWQVSNLNY